MCPASFAPSRWRVLADRLAILLAVTGVTLLLVAVFWMLFWPDPQSVAP